MYKYQEMCALICHVGVASPKGNLRVPHITPADCFQPHFTSNFLGVALQLVLSLLCFLRERERREVGKKRKS